MTDLLERIAAIVGPSGLLVGEDVRTAPSDWLGIGKREARAIVRPANTAELSEVMKLCNAAGQTVIAQGGLTGLVHGIDSTPEDVMISLERMRAIEHIDPVGRTATVQAGAPLQAVQEAAGEQGLQFALDLGARGSCTIGGNIATNAGGNNVVRYGMMRDQVLGLEAVLADGTVVSSMNRLLKNNTGYDLKQLFIGSEGTLGIVTRAVLRLRPKPKSENTALVAIDDFEALKGFFAFAGEELGGLLTAFEVMWREHYELIALETGRHTPPLPGGHGYYVVIETQGSHPERDAAQFAEAMEKALEEGLAADAVIAQTGAQRQSIWDIREDIAGLGMALAPVFAFDVSLPIADMDAYVGSVRASIGERFGESARMVVFGHLGDNNLHIGVSPGAGDPQTRKAVEDAVYGPLEPLGGSVSAEHGIGLEKKAYLALSRSPAELALMRTLKTALDPKNILNRGKIFDMA